MEIQKSFLLRPLQIDRGRITNGRPIVKVTSLPKVIWEEGRVAALSHTYTVKFALVTMARPKFAPKSTPSRGSIRKPHHLSHPSLDPSDL